MEGLRIRIPSDKIYPILPGDKTHKTRTETRVRFKATPKFYSPLQKLDEHLVRTEVLKSRSS